MSKIDFNSLSPELQQLVAAEMAKQVQVQPTPAPKPAPVQADPLAAILDQLAPVGKPAPAPKPAKTVAPKAPQAPASAIDQALAQVQGVLAQLQALKTGQHGVAVVLPQAPAPKAPSSTGKTPKQLHAERMANLEKARAARGQTAGSFTMPDSLEEKKAMMERLKIALASPALQEDTRKDLKARYRKVRRAARAQRKGQ